MSGRLGMTGESVVRGDALVYAEGVDKAMPRTSRAMQQIGEVAESVGDAFTSPMSAEQVGRGTRAQRYATFRDVPNPRYRKGKITGRHRKQTRRGALLEAAASGGGLPTNAPVAIGASYGLKHGGSKLAQAGRRLESADSLSFRRQMRQARKESRQRRAQAAGPVGKADSLSSMDERTARRLTGKYGQKGPLPKGLDRNERMKAYEARYVAGGGPKSEKHQRRADVASEVTRGALAAGGAGSAVELASRTKTLRKPLDRATSRARKVPGLKNVNRMTVGMGGMKVGLGAAAVGASSELFGRNQKQKARSARNNSAGVAAGALRRMRDYTPDDVGKAEEKKSSEFGRNVAVATNTAGMVGGPAAMWMAYRQGKPHLARDKQKRAEAAQRARRGEAGGMVSQATASAAGSKRGRLKQVGQRASRVVHNPKALAAGGVAAGALQGANWAGDTIAANMLRNKKDEKR